jgi:hypothetical protein
MMKSGEEGVCFLAGTTEIDDCVTGDGVDRSHQLDLLYVTGKSADTVLIGSQDNIL